MEGRRVSYDDFTRVKGERMTTDYVCYVCVCQRRSPQGLTGGLGLVLCRTQKGGDKEVVPYGTVM